MTCGIAGTSFAVLLSACGGGTAPSGSIADVIEDVAVVISVDDDDMTEDTSDEADSPDTSSDGGSVGNEGDEDVILPEITDVISVDVTGGTFVPSDFTPRAVSLGEIDQIIFDESGIILLPRAALSDELNQPGGLRQLLLDGSRIDFPQASNWTFRVLNNNDIIPRLLYVRFGFYLPSWSSYVNIVVGDEDDFITQFIDRYFADLEPDSGTGDIISDVITSSSSMTTVTVTGTTY